MTQHSLNLSPIGNCQVSALVDEHASIVWACAPRIDSEPVFTGLLSGQERGSDGETGTWRIDLEDCIAIKQHYLRNTPILITNMTDSHGAQIEIIDFAPRFRRSGRIYRPVAFARIVKPIKGSPRISVRLRPVTGWNATSPKRTFGSNHIRFPLDRLTMRLTTDGPIGMISEEQKFRLEKPVHFFLGPDESFAGAIRPTVRQMLADTRDEWQGWVRGLATPAEYQHHVIRAAITLKLCQHEETGAIVAAMTTSIPEHEGSERNWDYRYCWIRDAYYTVEALNRLGALDVLEGYLEYLRNIVDTAKGGHIQPLYDIMGRGRLEETIVDALPGYRSMGPVRVGNQAYEQIQHDAYGQIVLSSAQAFIDERLFRPSGEDDFHALESVGELAWQVYDKPDAGLWELRTRAHVHTYSAVMCWAACDRLARAAHRLGLDERANLWRERASTMREKILKSSWREDSNAFSSTFEGDNRDASLLQLLDLRFITADDPKFRSTLSSLEEALRRGNHMLRYASEDDFGLPQTAFNVCTFWLIEALHLSGRESEARLLFEEMLSRCTPAGLLSEDIDPETHELWGNYPQTYSLVGIINCAVLLSKPWSEFR